LEIPSISLTIIVDEVDVFRPWRLDAKVLDSLSSIYIDGVKKIAHSSDIK
jgi:hypothetical protein